MGDADIWWSERRIFVRHFYLQPFFKPSRDFVLLRYCHSYRFFFRPLPNSTTIIYYSGLRRAARFSLCSLCSGAALSPELCTFLYDSIIPSTAKMENKGSILQNNHRNKSWWRFAFIVAGALGTLGSNKRVVLSKTVDQNGQNLEGIVLVFD